MRRQEVSGSCVLSRPESIEERVAMHLEDGTHTLYVCPHAWALGRRVVNEETGEVRPLRCGSWSCPYCGPRKVNEWRQLIAEAGPTLHLVLTKAGRTVEEAARALTTFMQALRRGSKGRGRARVGARPAYLVEYLAVLERHADFEENGFHWHILLKGVEHIPYETIKELWRSATHGKAENGWIQRIQNSKAIGYVTKYLTKDIVRGERGTKEVERVIIGLDVDEQGQVVEVCGVVTEEVKSRARRIRYSRGFFPASTQELRARLFTPPEQRQAEGLPELQAACESGAEVQAGNSQKARSPWRLREIRPVISSVAEYGELLRVSLTEVISERVASGRRLSRRVLSVWNYQREQRYAGASG